MKLAIRLGILSVILASAYPAALQAATPAPIVSSQSNTAINKQNTYMDQSLWQFIRERFTLDHDTDNPRVQYYIYYYQTHTSILQAIINQGYYYMFNIAHQVANENLPMELALLPIIESGFRPYIGSSAGATGIWQLMPSTASRFNINTGNWWFDGRADTLQSTNAALAYLKILHDYFDNDWLLAIAAYNSGEGTVRNRLAANAVAHRPTDFWSLNLPQETRDYVPKLLAVSAIVANPEKYGIYLPEIPNRPLTGKVLLNQQMSLDLAAKLAGISRKVLEKLNPGFTKSVTPSGNYYLILPVEKITQFKNNYRKDYLHSRVHWQRYQVKAGDTLASVSAKTNTPVDLLQKVNKLQNNTLKTGQYLLYPVSGKPKIYIVQAGDTLSGIAKKFNTNVKQLASWNKLTTNSPLAIGKPLYVSSPQ